MKRDGMNSASSLPPLASAATSRWMHYIIDSLLAIGSTLLLTAIIFLLHLYPGLPDTLLLYLLVILALASMRGLKVSLLRFFSKPTRFVLPCFPPFRMTYALRFPPLRWQERV